MAPSSPRPSLLALAVLAALGGPGVAQAQPSTLDASVSIGIGAASGSEADRALFGQYNGLRTRRTVGLLGIEYERRDEANGRNAQLSGIDLLGDHRDLRLRWQQQGHWKFGAQYSESVRDEPLGASTGADLKVTRTRFGVAYAKTLGPQWQLDVNLASEKKEGARLFGIGFTCPSVLAPSCRGSTGTETGWALLMQPEPVDAHHSQVEVRLSHASGALRASIGYHGSYYRNRLGSLQPDVPASLNNALGDLLPLSAGLQSILTQPIALPPDNQSHQLDVTGSYAFTPTIHLNFKLAHAKALQHDDFAAAGLAVAPAGVTNLGARVDTTLALVGLSARPSPKLTLQAKLRWEERDDDTPLAPYNVEGTSTYTNRLQAGSKWRGQLQAHYQFTSDVRGTLRADHEAIDRGVFTPSSAVAGLSALRQETDETGLRAELRRRMNESFSGAIVLERSKRTGSNWLRDNSGLGVTEVPDASEPAAGLASAIFMPTLADRQRDTAKLLADWQPTDELSLQASAQAGHDRYTTPSVFGLRRSGTEQFSLDASYALSERWRFHANLGVGHQTLRQARPEGVTLDHDNRSASLGLGVVGKPIAKLEIGANLSHVDDRSVYDQVADAQTHPADAALLAASGGLPDIVFRQSILTLYGRYALDQRSEVRIDLLHQRSTWTDWAWGFNGVPFRYSDGSTVGLQPRQSATFVGLRYIHRWP